MRARYVDYSDRCYEGASGDHAKQQEQNPVDAARTENCLRDRNAKGITVVASIANLLLQSADDASIRCRGANKRKPYAMTFAVDIRIS